MGNYLVQKGDGWNAISKKTGISVEDLMRYNPEYQDGKMLQPGVKVKTSAGIGSKIVDTVSGWFDKSNKPQPDKFVKPGAYYVNYSDYDVSTGIGDGKQRLGHSGVLLVDDNGKLSYYEYGRYNKGIGVANTVASGMWNTQNITGNTLNEISQSLLNSQPKDAKTSTVRLTHVPADINKVREYVMNDANDPNRREYNIPGIHGTDLSKFSCDDKTCASEASDAIAAGWDASTVDKAIRSAVGAASKLTSFRATRNVAGSILPGGRGVNTPTPLNYTSQDYEDKWHDRGYETHTYTSTNNR